MTLSPERETDCLCFKLHHVQTLPYLFFSYAIHCIPVDHINYTVCLCSWPGVLISSCWITLTKPCSVSLLALLLIKVELNGTSPCPLQYTESHFKWRFCEAVPCGWIVFMAHWIVNLGFPKGIQQTPNVLQFVLFCFQINLDHGHLCNICFHLDLIGLN